jgi:hypothetical protein
MAYRLALFRLSCHAHKMSKERLIPEAEDWEGSQVGDYLTYMKRKKKKARQKKQTP